MTNSMRDDLVTPSVACVTPNWGADYTNMD